MSREKQAAPVLTAQAAAAMTKETFAGSKLISGNEYIPPALDGNKRNDFDAVNIESLKAQIESLRRERDEIVRIMGAASWAVNERLVYLTLRRLAADGQRENGWLVKDVAAWKVAKTCGLPKRTCRDVVRRLQSAKLINWKVDRPSGADYDEAITTIYVKECMPDAFAPLPLTKNGKSAQRRAVEFRARKKQLEEIVSKLTCPHCKKTGCMHVTVGAQCAECKKTMTPHELEIALGVDTLKKPRQKKKRELVIPPQNDATTPAAKFAAPPPSDGIIEPANWAHDPAANFAAPPLVAESATTPLERALPHLNNNGVHCRRGSKQAVHHA